MTADDPFIFHCHLGRRAEADSRHSGVQRLHYQQGSEDAEGNAVHIQIFYEITFQLCLL